MKDPNFDFDAFDELERECNEIRVWAVVWIMLICGALGWVMDDSTVAIIMIGGAIAFLHFTKDIIR